jgi:predicted DNA-binding transcriptional regulator AlpA
MDAAERIVLEPERRSLTGVGKTAWWQLERGGLAPRRRLIVGHRVGWLYSELLEWMRARQVGAPPAPRRALEARNVPPAEPADAA